MPPPTDCDDEAFCIVIDAARRKRASEVEAFGGKVDPMNDDPDWRARKGVKVPGAVRKQVLMYRQ